VGRAAVERAYLDELSTRLAGARAVSAIGSYATGAYEPGRSDLDVVAVVRATLAAHEKHAIVERVRDEALPCPARGLELVVYARAAVASGTTEPGFELNLNTGSRMTFRLDLEPDPSERHWFAIDRAILYERGVRIAGAPIASVFAPIPHDRLLPVVVESLRWHLDGETRSAESVLNACRALRYALDGKWSSKAEAAAWWLARQPGGAIVSEALRARAAGDAVDDARARAFLLAAIETVEGARRAQAERVREVLAAELRQ
jgi:hypothetical protein